jgi:stage II sporulation protein M
MKKQNPKNNLRSHFLDSISFIKSSRRYIYFAASLFALFFIIGLFFSPSLEIESQILKMIQEIMSQFQGLSLVQTIWAIFYNNSLVSLISILFGLLFGVFPIVASVSNGYIVGYVASKAISQQGVFILWRLLPHGIFELPAVLISMGIGTRLGLSITSKERTSDIFKSSMKTFILIIIPLLLIAATIEGFLVFFFK